MCLCLLRVEKVVKLCVEASAIVLSCNYSASKKSGHGRHGAQAGDEGKGPGCM